MNLKEDPSLNYDLEEGETSNPLEFVSVLRRRWLVVLVTLVVITSVGSIFVKTRKKVYTASASVVVSTQTGGSGSAGSALMQLLSLSQSSTAETQMAILSSPNYISEALRRLTDKERLYGFGGNSLPIWSFDAAQTKDTDVITVTIKSYRPEVSARFANLVIQTYLDEDLKRTNQAAAQAHDYVEREKLSIKKELYKAAEQLAKYQKASGMISPAVQAPEFVHLVVTAREAYDKARVASIADVKAIASINREIRSNAPEVKIGQVIAANPVFTEIQKKITDLQLQLAALRQNELESSPEVARVEEELREDEAQLKKTAQEITTAESQGRNPLVTKLLESYGVAAAQMAVDNASMDALAALVANRQREFLSIPDKALKFADLQETVLNLGKTYDLLTEKGYEFLIEEESSLAHGFVIATATPPSEPSSISLLRGVVASAALGLLLGFIMATVFERLDTRIHDPSTAEKLSKLTMLTAVPETKSDMGARAVIIGNVSEGASGFIESYRLLRNNITFAAADKDMRIIAVTSAGKAEGKSTTALNLAIAMGMDGKRVLLIDADLRRPALHTYIGVTREIGLTNVAKGMISLEQAVVSTPYEGVSCLVSGPLPPNPTEFLNSQHVRQLIEHAAATYDIVLIDSPPCTGLSDVQVVSTFVDGILLVVALDITQKHYLGAAVRLLRLANAPTIGMVLNRVRYNRTSYYYSYYYYYGYYGEDEKENGKPSKGKKVRKKT